MRRSPVQILLAVAMLASMTPACPGLVHAAAAADSRLARVLARYADTTDVVSGGFTVGSPLRVALGDHVAFDAIPQAPATAGLYVLAVDGDRIVLSEHYNTHLAPGAGEGLARDVERLRKGTFVIVAAKDEPTRLFGDRAQAALRSLGAERGLADAEHRTSYLLLGVKGMEPGDGLEKIGMDRLEHRGPKAGTAPPRRLRPPRSDEPRLDRAAGAHEGLRIGGTEVLYYLPRTLRPRTARYLVCVHGSGAWHRPGALHLLERFRALAERENLVIIAPVFDCLYNRPPDLARDLDGQLRFRDERIIRDWDVWDFLNLVNAKGRDRADHRLIEIFAFFRANLVDKPRFHLFGHSGGGQFAARFATVHPDLVERVAACAAGSYAFPTKRRSFPLGLATTKVERVYRHNELTDLLLTTAERDERMARFLNVPLFLVVGEKDLVGSNRPDLAWQGATVTARARGYVAALNAEARRLTEQNVYDGTPGVELHVLPGVGHDVEASIRVGSKLLFPPDEAE
ncbi:MAG: alpha/beta fold hydrolase [Planctomycetes bacterium]|nr:alpha/beta fold hydrolase [Planctomycetota bacterium]